MNPTKNIKYIEIGSDIFEYLCDIKYSQYIIKLQEEIKQLKEKVNSSIPKWSKIRNMDVYFDSENKILFPDTRKMQLTDLRVHYSDSYNEIVNYLNEANEDTLSVIKKQAKDDELLLPEAFVDTIYGFKAQNLTSTLLTEIIREEECPCLDEDKLQFETKNGKTSYILINDNSRSPIMDISGSTVRYKGCKAVEKALKLSICKFGDEETVFDIIVKYGIIPECFDEKICKDFENIISFVKFDVNLESISDIKNFIIEKKIDKLFDIDFREETISNEIENAVIDLESDDEIALYLKNYYEKCDYYRARIEKYDARWFLLDEGRGHWELWDEPELSINDNSDKEVDKKVNIADPKKVLHVKNGVIARNPVADVHHDAVVGIDFGTKSTIVALQDGDEEIIPLRVGMADYSIAPEVKHYENPTVMQFVNLDHFITKYSKSMGRPFTFWSDLLVSHEAFKNLIEAEKSNEYVSYVTDLKQWASGKVSNGRSDGHLIIKDGQGSRYDIDNYMELSDEDIDLIELYAYYIGLFINNMHMGIYLDYILSFPETFSVEVKDRIISSFTMGIKKSIPSIIFEDEECSNEFRVRQGSSEPAAYAACALEQYGIEPTDEGVFYGIFDFGGGTTDYDYGVWKNAHEDEYTYNYIIKHYGAGGDKTLGGENILQLLAYNVFSDDRKFDSEDSNLKKMRDHKLSFIRPLDGKIHPGTEAMNNYSENAILNTKQMMEALRPIWEEWREVDDWISQEKQKGSFAIEISPNVKISSMKNLQVKAELLLFSENGREPVTLVLDMDLINQTIMERIECGVRNFFEGLVQAYSLFEGSQKDKIHIFLAGNSSKSKRVLTLFHEYMVIYDEFIFEGREELEDISEESTVAVQNIFEKLFLFGDKEEKQYNSNKGFILYPPLGTEFARRIQSSNGIDVAENDLLAPTGKTGVAFGLLMCREGSMIRVESEKKETEQIKLNYHIGINYRKEFKVILDRDSEYNKWLKFSKISEGTQTFEFFYTELSEVLSEKVLIKGNSSIHKHKCLVDNVSENAYIYFRFIKPNKLEYVVADEKKIESNNYLSKIYSVDL